MSLLVLSVVSPAPPVTAELPPVVRAGRANELAVATQPQTPLRQVSSETNVFEMASAGATTSRRNRTELHLRAPILEALLIWAEKLVHRLDPLDIFETPFATSRRDSISLESPRSVELKARVRPVQMPNGGYGLVARMSF